MSLSRKVLQFPTRLSRFAAKLSHGSNLGLPPQKSELNHTARFEGYPGSDTLITA